MVTVRTGPISADDPARDVPKEKWFNLMLARCTAVHTRLPYDCRSLLGYVREAEEYRMWEYTGHADLDDFIRNGLEVDPDLLEWARIGLSAFEEGVPVPLQDAAEVGKRTRQQEIMQQAQDAQPLRPHGRPKAEAPGEKIGQHGHATPYTLARLKRDHPELLDQVAAGALTPNEAARLAGFRKPTRSIAIDSPHAAVRALLRIFPAEDLRAALAELTNAPVSG
jgi:hypothetical protein